MLDVHKFHRLSAFVGLLGTIGASLSGCGGSGAPIVPLPNRSVCLANTAHNDGRARWTVLIYVNAANDLQRFSLTNVGQMASIGSDSNVNIVIQWKQANCQTDCGTPSFLGTRRYLLKQHNAADVTAIQNGVSTSLDPDRLADPQTNRPDGNGNSTSDMGDWNTLKNFVEWGAQAYPSDNLAVVVWDHGSGWRPTRTASGNKLKRQFRAVSQDAQSLNEIQTWELPLALGGLQQIQPLDMLILDASLEQMLEISYEVRNVAKVMVGSEESPPGLGYPYDRWLSAIKSSGKNRCDVGQNIMQTFLDYYAQNDPSANDITQSVLDLSKMDVLATALDNFALVLMTHVNDQATLLQTSRENVQHYTVPYDDNKDLFHYADLISKGTTFSDLKQAAEKVKTALTGADGAVLFSGHGTTDIGKLQANSNGLAIYIPTATGYVSSYANLALAHRTHWDEFLLSQTR